MDPPAGRGRRLRRHLVGCRAGRRGQAAPSGSSEGVDRLRRLRRRLEVPLDRRLDRRPRRGRGQRREGHLLLIARPGPTRSSVPPVGTGGGLARDGDDRPIGMFDCGFGGLTVARAVIDLLPARGPRLPRRHRPLPVRPPAARRGARLRPPDRRPPGRRPRREARWSSPATPRRPPRSTSCGPSCPVPVVGVIEPGVRALVQATAAGRVGGHRHGRHDRLGRLPAGGRGDRRRPVRARPARLPGVRRVRRAGRDRQRPGPRAGRAAAGPGRARPRSTPCCSAAPTTRTWPARSAT